MLSLSNTTRSDNPNPYFAQFTGSSLNGCLQSPHSIPYLCKVFFSEPTGSQLRNFADSPPHARKRQERQERTV